MTTRDLNTFDNIMRNPFVALSQVEIKIMRKAIDLLKTHFAGEDNLACVFCWIYDHEFRYDPEARQCMKSFATKSLFATHFVALVRKICPGFSLVI